MKPSLRGNLKFKSEPLTGPDDKSHDGTKKSRNDDECILDENQNSTHQDMFDTSTEVETHQVVNNPEIEEFETNPDAIDQPHVGIDNNAGNKGDSLTGHGCEGGIKEEIKASLRDFFSDEQQCGLFAEVLVRKELSIKEALEDDIKAEDKR